jgi:hypothetical protein
VQNKLYEIAMQASMFYTKVYNKDTKVVSLGAAVAPAEVLSNETETEYGETRNRQRLERAVTSRTFELIVRFNVEVDAAAFEEALNNKPIRLPKAVDPDVQIGRHPAQITIELMRKTAQQPVQQGAPMGSRLQFIVRARYSGV